MAGPLPLNALNAFEVAARHESFSKAAEELNVTPAAISQQIRMLEELLGVQLFHRLNRGLALTDAGKSGLSKLQHGFQSVTEAVQQIQSEQSQSLNVWMAPSFASKWLMPRMHRFVEKHPSIDLRISASVELVDTSASAPSLSEDILHRHDIDVAIRFGSGNYPGCRVEKLMDVTALPMCSPSLLEDSSRPLRCPEDLAGHTLLHDETPYEGRPDWSGWLDAVGVTSVDGTRGLRFNRVSLALAAAVEAQGVVLSLEQLAANDLEKGRLVIPFEHRVKLTHAYHCISLEHTEDDERVRTFKEWLFEEASNMKTTG
ncbi:transcriptional regulator GcvA [Granulosicoccus antarcticus]|uniref:Glycine cleavage system transcriptional activator n=1 Tax=Granulosicoccus antarcticus IMCC3135 TaxID=1192854 RepID=A0A2Z2NWF2_9GAMM|nr:transcriptional regulator GcvA [Granulosicoccus antarcticus]ASJ71474.1 Glycine cleavage system transcriptional activator [Granulosicoccus antarcticus IMCC3135]